jgi:hypothetical protein
MDRGLEEGPVTRPDEIDTGRVPEVDTDQDANPADLEEQSEEVRDPDDEGLEVMDDDPGEP